MAEFVLPNEITETIIFVLVEILKQDKDVKILQEIIITINSFLKFAPPHIRNLVELSAIKTNNLHNDIPNNQLLILYNLLEDHTYDIVHKYIATFIFSNLFIVWNSWFDHFNETLNNQAFCNWVKGQNSVNLTGYINNKRRAEEIDPCPKEKKVKRHF